MQFTTVLAALAAFGVSAVSAAPAPIIPTAPGLVMTWDLFVGRGVAKVQNKYPGAKVVEITGSTFNGKPTSNIMSVQKFEMKFSVEVDEEVKTIQTSNYDLKTGDDVPFFTEPTEIAGRMIGNTAFTFDKTTVKLGGFEAQAAFKKDHPTATYTSIVLRNGQHPYGQYYYFTDVKEEGSQSSVVQIKAN